MKRITVFVSLLLCVLLLASCGSGEISTKKGEKLFGSFTAVDMDGYPVDSSVFAEKKVTMVNIWGTFCSPCIKEMPSLKSLNDKYSNEGFQVVGIPTDVVDKNFSNIPEKIAEAEEIINTTGADYMHIIPSKSLSDAHLNHVQTVPETLFFDSEGCLLGDIYYGSKSESEWEKIIIKFLEAENES